MEEEMKRNQAKLMRTDGIIFLTEYHEFYKISSGNVMEFTGNEMEWTGFYMR
jgi:hypothetical protein